MRSHSITQLGLFVAEKDRWRGRFWRSSGRRSRDFRLCDRPGCSALPLWRRRLGQAQWRSLETQVPEIIGVFTPSGVDPVWWTPDMRRDSRLAGVHNEEEANEEEKKVLSGIQGRGRQRRQVQKLSRVHVAARMVALTRTCGDRYGLGGGHASSVSRDSLRREVLRSSEAGWKLASVSGVVDGPRPRDMHMVTGGLLALLAILPRASMEFDPIRFFVWIGTVAAIFLVGTLAWGLLVLPRLGNR